MKKQKLFCKVGNHDWSRKAQRGKPPICCPKHRAEASAPMGAQELWCEAGEHKWTRKPTRGKKPKNCPEHRPVVAVGGSGDNLVRAREARKEKAKANAWATIKNIRENRSHTACDCKFFEGMNWDDLKAMKGGCTAPFFVCPTLDTVRRALDHMRPDEPAFEVRIEGLVA